MKNNKTMTCRTCMEVSGCAKPIFLRVTAGDGLSLAQMLIKVADVKVERGDGLPDHICEECEKKINQCYEFKLNVEHWDRIMRELMEAESVPKLLKEEVLLESDLANYFKNNAKEICLSEKKGKDTAMDYVKAKPNADLGSTEEDLSTEDDIDDAYDFIPQYNTNPRKADKRNIDVKRDLLGKLSKCKQLTIKKVEKSNPPAVTKQMKRNVESTESPAHRGTLKRECNAPKPTIPIKKQKTEEKAFQSPAGIKLNKENFKFPANANEVKSVKPDSQPVTKNNLSRCDICESVFKYPSDLAVHRELHFQCHECTVSFATSKELAEHKRCFHSLRFQCYICEKRLADRTSLYLHKRTHDTEIACEICGNLISEYALRRHLHTHKKNKWRCSYCKQSFELELEQRRHMNECVNYKYDSNQRVTYKCQYCDKYFDFPSTCKIHQRICSGWKSDPLTAFFATYRQL